MKWKAKRYFILAGLLFFFFVLLTVCVTCVDTEPIGPEETVIGLASINHFVFRLVGVNLIWYYVTDWLGVIAVLFAVGFDYKTSLQSHHMPSNTFPMAKD